jgi:hypothetical protein
VEEDGVVRSYRDLWVWKEGMDLADKKDRKQRADSHDPIPYSPLPTPGPQSGPAAPS